MLPELSERFVLDHLNYDMTASEIAAFWECDVKNVLGMAAEKRMRVRRQPLIRFHTPGAPRIAVFVKKFNWENYA